jgi:ISXO2-like transposase domain
VAVALAESKTVVKPIIADFIANAESYLNSDNSAAYTVWGRTKFIEHRSVIHSKELVGPNGENNNLAEELNFRFDRAEQGIYLNLEAKYLLDYAVEIAFRADTRRLSNGSQLLLAMHMALSVGAETSFKVIADNLDGAELSDIRSRRPRLAHTARHPSFQSPAGASSY